MDIAHFVFLYRRSVDLPPQWVWAICMVPLVDVFSFATFMIPKSYPRAGLRLAYQPIRSPCSNGCSSTRALATFGNSKTRGWVFILLYCPQSNLIHTLFPVQLVRKTGMICIALFVEIHAAVVMMNMGGPATVRHFESLHTTILMKSLILIGPRDASVPRKFVFRQRSYSLTIPKMACAMDCQTSDTTNWETIFRYRRWITHPEMEWSSRRRHG